MTFHDWSGLDGPGGIILLLLASIAALLTLVSTTGSLRTALVVMLAMLESTLGWRPVRAAILALVLAVGTLALASLLAVASLLTAVAALLGLIATALAVTLALVRASVAVVWVRHDDDCV